MVTLELQVLHEIGRVAVTAQAIVSDLGRRLRLRTCDRAFPKVLEHVISQSVTRDPFDRLIVGQAAVGSNILITKDILIRKNYAHAVW